jgi:dienelactone hydrolase
MVAPLLAACLIALTAACSAPMDASPGPATPGSSRSAAHHSSAETTGPSPRAAAAQAGVGVLGQFRTAERRLVFVEPAHNGRTGDRLGPRTLLTDVRYPLAARPATTNRPAAGPLPLIVFGPGFMQCGRPYSGLLRAWASAGYVVASVNFPRSDCLTGAAATESDLVNQPADVSYVITRMLRLSAGHRFLAGRLNPDEIAITGQSDGGDTVAAVGANTCCTDHRVAAVAVLSGAQWPAMPGKFFAGRPVPMLFTQGSADTVNLPGCSAALYHADPARQRYYLDLFGADHTGPYWGVNRYERIVARVTLAFFDRYVLGQDSAGPAMRRYADVPGIAALFSHGGGHLPPGPCMT